MRSAFAALLLLVAACGDGNKAAVGQEQRAPRVQTAELTGLYESQGSAERRSRMCMISARSGVASFAFVALAADGSACSGAGEAVRRGEVVRLTMSGDEECTIDAKLVGTRLAFPADVPGGCAYYCSPRATLAGKTFEKTGGTADSARRARDLVGDPLCG
jgi:hypothetical protein